MLRSTRFSLAALPIVFAAASFPSVRADLTPEQKDSIVSAAQRIGETVKEQGRPDAVRTVVTSFVENDVARTLNPSRAEAPLSPEEQSQAKVIVDQVLANLHVDEPVNPKPAPTPKPERPSDPTPAPHTNPGTGPQPGNGPGPQPVIVWVVTPAVQPAPVAWPAAMPIAPAVPGFAPLPGWPGGAPTIHIKNGWFGHPDKVWYSRH